MDPISLILTALLTGATAALSETAGQVIKESYQRLKTLLHQRLAGQPVAQVALDGYEKKPEVWKAPLAEQLQAAGVSQDRCVIEAAQALLQALHPQEAAQGKYAVQISGQVQGFAQGDAQSVQMHFGNRSETP